MILDPEQRRRLFGDPSARLGFALVTLVALAALVGPWLVGDPNTSHFGLPRRPSGAPPGPSLAHPLGLDPLYRDVLARLLHGGRISLSIATGATALASVLGVGLGLLAGYYHGTRRRLVDDAVMRLVDVALAFPYLILITAIGVALDRADALTIALILGLTSWTGIARVVRAKALAVKRQDYVAASRALGATSGRIVLSHLLPAVAPVVLVIGSQAIGQMILAEAVLSYLTVGIDPPSASWGRMLHEAEGYLGIDPLLVAAPGLAILLAVIGFARLGEGLNRALDARDRPRPRYGAFADLAVVSAVVVVVILGRPQPFAAPQAAPAPTDTPRIGGRLHLATTTPLSVLDPALAYHGDARTIGDLVYATLLTWNHDGELVPDLAARLERAEDGKRFTVTLRDGLVFHDGSPLRAADVKRSLERTLHPQSPCPGAQLYQGIVGAAAFAADPTAGLAGVVVEDERRVTFRLAEPDASFPALLGLGFAAPVCASAGAIADPKAAAPPCGAGPFRIERFVRGEQLSLRRQASPGPEGPFVDAIDFTFDMPARTQRYRFERGELDFLLDLTGIDAQRYAADARWAPYLAWSRQPITHSIFLNTSIPPFSDVHLRRAVAFGVDPAVLSEVRPDVVEATRLMPPSLPGPRDRAPMRRHDPAAALEEMARAGFAFDPATGRGGYPEPIDYLTVPDSFEQAAAEIFQQQLAAIGLRLRLRLLSFSAYLGTISTPGAARMGWRGWAADYPDPATFFEPLLTSEGLEPGTQNVSFFRSPAMDGLLAQAHHTLDPEARFALYERAEAMLAAEAPLVPVYGSRALEVHQPWVRGYAPHPVLGARLRAVWLDAEGRP